MKDRILLSWSGGKDSARSLYEITRGGSHEVAALLTTLSSEHQRVSMHGVRRALLEEQARAVGLPLQWVELPVPCSNADYEAAMRRALEPWIENGIRTVAFGDISLEDLRAYRDAKLAAGGLAGLYPLWKRDTRGLAEEFLALGFRAIVTCVDPRALGRSFAGRDIDARFLAELPATVDPCGENGEFHSFVYDGPGFARRVEIELGELVERDGFWFQDLVLARDAAAAAL